jgi:hypothetical protein
MSRWFALLGLLSASCSEAPKAAVEPEATEGRLLLEINHPTAPDVPCREHAEGICRDLSHWVLSVSGVPCRDLEEAGRRVKVEADRHLYPPDPKISELRVTILADAKTPYPLPQKAMNLCAKLGVYRIEVKARP